MSYSIFVTHQAQADLKKIFKYISVELQSLQNAAKQLDRLDKAIMSLDEMPERFRVYDKDKWRNRNLRIMPVDKYLVFYIPNHDAHIVTVLRVMYGGRDIDKQLDNV